MAHVPFLLLIEDDEAVRTALEMGLTRQGHRVVTAASGEDGLRMLREQRPDLIVLDVMLPDINGKEVCQRVRSDSNMEEVRILCISGMIEEDKIQELKLAGADDFLHKPFDLEELIDRMCAQLEMEPASASA